MAHALDAARELARLAHRDSKTLTQLSIQKLLYYAQGWSLAIRGKPLFTEPLQAWKRGPVVPSLWDGLTEHGDKPIGPDELGEPEGLNDGDRALIETVWTQFRGHSAHALVRMSHAESPWQNARAGLPEDARSSNVISIEDMKEHFREEVNRLLQLNVNLAEEYPDEEPGESGTVSLREALAGRRDGS